jgi:hypothetical protein
MLVLSRRVNEGVVLGDRVTITLAQLSPKGVLLTIQKGADASRTPVELGPGERVEIELGVRLTLVDVHMAAVCPNSAVAG